MSPQVLAISGFSGWGKLWLNKGRKHGDMCILFCLCLFLSGCEVKDKAQEMNGLTGRYDTLMSKGKTTPTQDQLFIHTIAEEALEFDRALRGTKKAEATRAAAVEGAQ